MVNRNSQAEVEKLYQERGFSGRVGFGQKPAVIAVDMIIGFTDPSSPLAADLEGPLTESVRILQAARHQHVPVFFTTVEYEPDFKDAGLFPTKVAGLKWLVTGSRWVELDPRLERQPGERLIRKRYASAFFGTELLSLLRSQAVDTLIVIGCTTSGCVRATVVDALQNGFRAIVPRDAVGDRAAGPHEANLLDIDAKYGDVVTVNEVLRYLSGLSRHDSDRTTAVSRNA